MVPQATQVALLGHYSWPGYGYISPEIGWRVEIILEEENGRWPSGTYQVIQWKQGAFEANGEGP
jgi:hypothetical protein